MKKLYTLLVVLLVTVSVSAQTTTIDLSAVDQNLTTEFEGETVLDVAECASPDSAPALSYTNPFQGLSFTEAEIAFDVYTYEPVDSIKVLGSLISIFDPALGRMYFTNGSYLGFNNGSFVDGNLDNFGIGVDFLGVMQWRSVQLQFDTTGYAVYVDGELAYDETSTDVPSAGNLADYGEIITFLQNASTLLFGTGSFWSSNTRPDGTYWDAQFSYMKNITFTPNFSTTNIEEVDFSQFGAPVRESYFNLNGAEVNADVNALAPGMYVKKEFFRNGAVRASKVVKMD